jgi:outer membrane immunogenic protein
MRLFVVGAFLLALPTPASAQFAIQFPNGSGSDSGSGWVAGLHTGYNWQRGTLVYGVEADINWTDLKSEITKGFNVNLPGGVPLPSARTTSEIDWFGTVRGRLGWTNGPVLFYGTGGLAYGKVNLDSRFDFGQFQNLAVSSHADSTKVGWVAGVGINYLWNPNTILSLNYQYVDLGKTRISDSATNPGITISQSATAHAAFHEVTVGLSWLFAPADARVAARGTAPWEGWYAGGQAGGAWGLDTDARYSSINLLPSDIRLKRDIVLVGRRDDGLGIYRYRYLWSDTVYVGVMAQEVALIRPDAVVHGAFDDYLRVDYAKLGMKMVALPN